MRKGQLLSIVFSLIMATGLTAGAALAFAESRDDNYDFDDRLESFCEMTDKEKDQLFEDHPRLAQFEERLTNYCELDENEREDFIEEFVEEHFSKYKERNGWDFDDMLDRYCEMSEEDKTAFIEKYPMASDHQDKMAEYCLLDETEREAFIEEHKDEYKKTNYKIKYLLEKYCKMTDEEKETFMEKHQKAEDHQDKMAEYCSLEESEKGAFIEEHKDEYDRDYAYKKQDYNIREKMDEFCEMSENDKAEIIEKYPMASEYQDKMAEYCSLDEADRDVFIDDFKDSMEDKKYRMKDSMKDKRYEDKDSMKDKRYEDKDSMKDKISDHRDTMKDQISDHRDSMKFKDKNHPVLRASTLTDEQKLDIIVRYSELRDFKHSLRDKSISDSDKEELRDQFMEKAKELAMIGFSPRHQVAAGIDANLVECSESFQLVVKTSNAIPWCVKATTAEKLIERGIAIYAT